jgi:hypothetical protein
VIVIVPTGHATTEAQFFSRRRVIRARIPSLAPVNMNFFLEDNPPSRVGRILRHNAKGPDGNEIYE